MLALSFRQSRRQITCGAPIGLVRFCNPEAEEAKARCFSPPFPAFVTANARRGQTKLTRTRVEPKTETRGLGGSRKTRNLLFAQ
jgi:hypothetical protein